MKSPLKFAGGKSWLVPFLLRAWRASGATRFVEPFAGSAAASLAIGASSCALNDRNPHVANFWKGMRRGIEVTVPFLNEEAHYYELRARYNALVAEGRGHQSEATQIFYYLNRTGYNGLLRVNRQGQLNTPFGSYKTINYRQDFSDITARMAGWNVTERDFQDVRLRPGDFLFCDPPYPGTYNGYTAQGFSWEDHRRLALWAMEHDGPVVVTNALSPATVLLYGRMGFEVRFKALRRSISAGARNMATEAIFLRRMPPGVLKKK